MGWRDNKYYYRSSRVNGRVKNSYAGSGSSALIMAQQDAHERQRQQVQRRAQRELQKRERALDAKIDELGETLNALVTTLYLASGYHTHKREWRKARKNG